MAARIQAVCINCTRIYDSVHVGGKCRSCHGPDRLFRQEKNGELTGGYCYRCRAEKISKESVIETELVEES